MAGCGPRRGLDAARGVPASSRQAPPGAARNLLRNEHAGAMHKPLFLLLALLTAGAALVLLTGQYTILALVLVLCLPVGFLFIKYPILAFYLIVFFIPMGAFRGLNETYSSLTISKITGVVLVVILLGHLLVRKSDLGDLKSNLWPLLTFFFLVNLISSLLSPFPLDALNALRLLFTAYTMFAIGLFLITPDRLEHGLLYVLVASVTLGALLSIAGYAFKLDMFTMNVTDEIHMTRALGGTGDPNFHACMIIFNVPLMLHKIIKGTTARTRLVFACLLLVNIAAVILTFSRSGALVLSVTLLLAVTGLGLRPTPRQFGLVLGALLLIGTVAMISIPSTYWERQRTITTQDDPSLVRRASYLMVAWDAVRKAPLLGQGTGTFFKIYAQTPIARYFDIRDLERQAHNTYVEVVVGSGILGLSLFCLIILRTLKNFGRAVALAQDRGDENAALLYKAYRLSFLSLLAYLFLLSDVPSKYFWISMAVSQVACTAALRASITEAPPAMTPAFPGL